VEKARAATQQRSKRLKEVNTMGQWTFLTNHALVFICLANHPEITGRELSLSVGITERAVRRIIDDLVAESYIVKKRVGRRIIYTVNSKLYFRHPAQKDKEIGILLRALGWEGKPKRSKS
jgi:DNA-binding MarR family transcriptional regulator